MDLDGILKKLNTIVEWICYLLLAIIVAAVVSQVVSRYVFNSPLTWTEETSRYCFIWVSMLGAWLTLRRRKHMKFDMLETSLKGKIAIIHKLTIDIAIFIYLVILLVACYRLLPIVAGQTSPSLGISMAIPYSGIATGILLMAVEEGLIIIRSIKKLVANETE